MRLRPRPCVFRLDDQPYRIALAGAQAQLQSARNEIATLQATYRQSLAQIEQARTDVAFYQTAFERQQDLGRRGVSSQAALDQAKRDLDALNEHSVEHDFGEARDVESRARRDVLARSGRAAAG